MAKKGYAIETYAAGMFIRQEQYAQRVKHLYEQAVNELLALAAQMPIDVDGEVFSFSDNPRIANETTKVIRRLFSQVYGEIKHGVEAEWKYANLSCDRLIESIFGKQIKETNLGARWFQRNKEAMDQFFKRTQADGGMNLSQRVWKYTGDLRGEMENAISVSMGEGVSAATMSRRVRQYLREPNKLFRRVRGSDGKLHLSKPAQLYHPGQGVYRSSYKNAMRLTRTETNAAYRAADEDRWSRMDFVVGFEVKKSNNHPDTDICDDLCGKYPKGFVFTAWHPQCRCFVVPILATPQEMANLQRIAISGGNTSTYVSANHVRTVPPQFTKWIEDNADRIERAAHKPYFIAQNFVGGDITKGLTPQVLAAGLAKTTVPQLIHINEEQRYNIVRKFDNGGSIAVHQLVNPNDSDYNKLMDVATFFAGQGHQVRLTPKMTRPPKFIYSDIYKTLMGTRYEGKCPDLWVDGLWYEHEGFITTNPKKAFRNMMNDGLRQSDRLIIDKPELSDAYMKRVIHQRVKDGHEISEVWLKEGEIIRILYKKFEE